MANSLSSTTASGAACRIRSTNCRSVASTAASGILLTRPMVMQLPAFNPAAEPNRAESMKSGIVSPAPLLFGRDQRRLRRLRRAERLIEIGDEIVDMLDADAEPDHFRLDAGPELLVGRHLPVCGRGRVASQRLGVAHIDQPLEQAERVVKLLAALKPAGNAEGQQRTGMAPEIFVRQFVIGIVGKAGVIDPRHARILAQEFGDAP